jgi:hypothetical protein
MGCERGRGGRGGSEEVREGGSEGPPENELLACSATKRYDTSWASPLISLQISILLSFEHGC